MKIFPKDTCKHEQSVKTWIENLYHNANKCDLNHHHVQLDAFYRYELQHNSLKQHGNHNMGISVCYELPWYVLTNFAFHQFDNHKYHKHNSSLHCYFSCVLYLWERPEYVKFRKEALNKVNPPEICVKKCMIYNPVLNSECANSK